MTGAMISPDSLPRIQWGTVAGWVWTLARPSLLHEGFRPRDGAEERLGAGDALADVVTEVGEISVAFLVGEGGGDELVCGGFVLGGERAWGWLEPRMKQRGGI